MNKLLVVDSYRRVNECMGLTKYLINPSYNETINKIYNIVNVQNESKYLNERFLNKILRGRYPKENAGKFLSEFQRINEGKYDMEVYMIRSSRSNNVLYQFHKPY
jgi:hypothetical protein